MQSNENIESTSFHFVVQALNNLKPSSSENLKEKDSPAVTKPAEEKKRPELKIQTDFSSASSSPPHQPPRVLLTPRDTPRSTRGRKGLSLEAAQANLVFLREKGFNLVGGFPSYAEIPAGHVFSASHLFKRKDEYFKLPCKILWSKCITEGLIKETIDQFLRKVEDESFIYFAGKENGGDNNVFIVREDAEQSGHQHLAGSNYRTAYDEYGAGELFFYHGLLLINNKAGHIQTEAEPTCKLVTEVFGEEGKKAFDSSITEEEVEVIVANRRMERFNQIIHTARNKMIKTYRTFINYQSKLFQPFVNPLGKPEDTAESELVNTL